MSDFSMTVVSFVEANRNLAENAPQNLLNKGCTELDALKGQISEEKFNSIIWEILDYLE